jgi:hypothetical protein
MSHAFGVNRLFLAVTSAVAIEGKMGLLVCTVCHRCSGCALFHHCSFTKNWQELIADSTDPASSFGGLLKGVTKCQTLLSMV